MGPTFDAKLVQKKKTNDGASRNKTHEHPENWRFGVILFFAGKYK